MRHQGTCLQNIHMSPCCMWLQASKSELNPVLYCPQSLAEGLHESRKHKADRPAVSRASSAQLHPARQPPGQAQQASNSQRLAMQAAPHHHQQQQQQEEEEAGHQLARASLKRATQEAEQGLQQQSEEVQRQMQSMQGTFQEVCQSLQSLQAAFQQPQPSAAAMHSRHKVCTPAPAPAPVHSFALY